MKYIDAEKLYKQVDGLMARYAENEKEFEADDEELSIFYQGKRKMCSELLGIIDSLQQEQQEVDLDESINDFLLNNSEFLIECDSKVVVQKLASHFYELGLNARKV